MAKVQSWSITFASRDDARVGTEGPFYELSGEVLFPERIELRGTPQPVGAAPYAHMRFEVDFESGQAICTKLVFEWPVGTTNKRAIEALTLSRDINIAQLLGQAHDWVTACSRAIVDVVQGGSWEDGRYIFERDDSHNTLSNSTALRRKRSLTDEFLMEVAEVYNNDETGQPTIAVADHYHFPGRPPSEEVRGKRTAVRWVRLARDRGFIPAYVRPSKSSTDEEN